jgi:hypothetical protein
MPDDICFWWAPIPGTAQEEFFDNDDPDVNLLFTGGWGSGKTTALCAKSLKLSAINAPLPGIWLVPNWDHVEKTILPALESIDPDSGQPWFLTPGQYHYHQTKHILTWVGGGPIWFMTAENFKGIAGPNVAWLAVDEPGSIRHEAWRNAVARVRHPGAKLRQRVASGTPEGLGWLMDMFGDPSRPDHYKVYRMRTDENTELLRHNPDFLTQVKENASEAEVQSYLGGLFVNLTGALAHPQFSEDLHWLETVEVEPTVPLRLCFDFNVDPMTLGLAQILPGPHGPEVRVVDWVSEYGGTVETCCQKLKERYPKGWRPGAYIYGDATGRARHVKSLKSNYQIIREALAGWASLTERVPSVNPPVSERVNAVNRLLKDARGVTRLWVRKTQPSRICPTKDLVRSFQKTIIPSGTDDIQKKAGETHTHPAEALGYLVAWEFPITKPLVTVGSGYYPHLL